MAKRSKNKAREPKRDIPSGTANASSPPTASFSWTVLVQAAVIVVAALCIYAPALRGDWLWDDNVLVSGNRELRSWEGLGQIWFSAPSTDYWPLTWTLLWLEWHLWGSTPAPYHVVSLALHVSSGLLIWRLLGRLGLRWGWLGGLLFVIHPLMVESVAWIAEIKNTLSLPLFLLACDAWLDAEERNPFGYAKSVLFYLAAMLAKTSTVMLPLVLLLYCWWKRGRVTRQEIDRMIPYGVIALILGLITVHFQTFGEHKLPVALGGPMERCLSASTALFFYLGKFLLPLNLVPIYPRWTFSPPSLIEMLTLPALAGLLWALWIQRKGWGRHVTFGFGFFAVNALPVLGLVKMEYLRFSWVADHLAYLPIVGLIGLAVGAGEYLRERIPASLRLFGTGAVAALLAGLAWLSHAYAGVYFSQEALWTYTLRYNPESWLAENNLALILIAQGHIAEATEHFERALEIKPDDPAARDNLGNILLQSGQPAKAAALYQQNLQQHPDDSRAHNNLGNALVQLGRFSEAVEQYQLALHLSPEDPDLHNNLAAALYQMGRMSEAEQEFEQVYRLDPNYPNIQLKLAAARQKAGGM